MKAGARDTGTKLNVAAVAKRLMSELETIGFKRIRAGGIKAHPLTLVNKLNEETEVFLHPGVQRRGESVLIDPIIGVNNTKLRERLLRTDGPWKGAPKVCHAYLGMLDSWGRFYISNDRELENAAREIARSVVEVGLPVMREYDSLDKVRKLFQDDLAHIKRVPVVVLYAREKLERMEEH